MKEFLKNDLDPSSELTRSPKGSPVYLNLERENEVSDTPKNFDQFDPNEPV